MRNALALRNCNIFHTPQGSSSTPMSPDVLAAEAKPPTKQGWREMSEGGRSRQRPCAAACLGQLRGRSGGGFGGGSSCGFSSGGGAAAVAAAAVAVSDTWSFEPGASLRRRSSSAAASRRAVSAAAVFDGGRRPAPPGTTADNGPQPHSSQRPRHRHCCRCRRGEMVSPGASSHSHT
jgi:hypothetical protein